MSLHSCFISSSYGIEAKIRMAGQAGFDAVAVLYAEAKQVGESFESFEVLRRTVDAANLAVSELDGLACRTLSISDPYTVPFEEFERGLDCCLCLGCDLVLTCTSLGRADLGMRARELAELGRIAGRRGVRVGYEFHGFAEQVNALETAWEIVRAAKCDSVGIVLDMIHFYKGGSSLQTLKRIPIDRIHTVHMNDAPPVAKADLTDEGRLLPGQGVIPLNEILSVLFDRGYCGPLTLEVFNELYWRLPAEEAVRRAKVSMEPYVRD